jgi:predicted acylesterase/phospholipase RssA
MATRAGTKRQVRFALVLNGGVSLAVWIGGVTREIDAARRGAQLSSSDAQDTAPLYGEILTALDQEVVVDVIGGASAGGINGVMLGAAICNGEPLADLRETWITLGDFRTLLRPPAPANPPSLMKGDDVVLSKLREMIREVYGPGGPSAQGDGPRLYVYVTATDLFGYPQRFRDSTGRSFDELDHRRVFALQDGPIREQPQLRNRGAMRPVVWLRDPDAPELLARAARSSSSFPVAFEAHRLDIVDNDKQAREHWLVDGGILDNQPFNPVLDRIAVLPADCPVKRVVMYVVPYVTEAGAEDVKAPPEATARDTYEAAGKLPRDLPKLLGLERVTRESAAQEAAETTRARLRSEISSDTLADLAKTLFDSYVETRRVSASETFHLWTSKNFRPGPGVLGQDPAEDPETLRAATPTPSSAKEPPVRDEPWLPAKRRWSKRGDWGWGLSPAERVAAWALLFLADAARARGRDDTSLAQARRLASDLVWEARLAKGRLVEAFEADRARHDASPLQHARNAYRAAPVEAALRRIRSLYRRLDEAIGAANKGLGKKDGRRALSVQELLDFEVVQNAFGIQELQVPFPFAFIFASAGVRNSLGHQAATPATKLAGMKLNHFGGFLKRSWRANDWLWGRLDGAEHVIRALVDLDRVQELSDLPGDTQHQPVVRALADAAFGRDDAEIDALQRLWGETLLTYKLGKSDYRGGRDGFRAVLADAVDERENDADLSRRCFAACRRALAARIQLRILEKDLARVAETARDDVEAGASQIASGAFWYGRFFSGSQTDPATLRDLFVDMHIGEESLTDEMSSRHVFDVGSQGTAVAAAMFAGDRGGLPAAARGALGTLRGLSLASSRLIQLLARAPAAGAAVFAVLAALTVWAAVARSTLVGALLPSLALLTAIVGVAVLTLATSVFERSLGSARVLAFSFVIGLPLAFALTFRWPGFTDSGTDWLDRHVGEEAVTVAAVLALVAAGIASVRLVGGIGMWSFEWARGRLYPRSWRRLVMSLYRWPVVGALLTLAGGFIAQRTLDRASSKGWVSVAQERRGTLFVLALLATLLVAALLEEVVVPVAVWIRWHVWRPARLWVTEHL